MARRLEVVPQSPALGAEIRGVDLFRPLDDETFAAIHRAFLDRHVIFLRNQSLTPHQLLDFASRFGTPNDYPMVKGLPECPKVTAVIKEPHETINFGADWHSDTTYLEEPPLATLLLAKEIPAIGGDTLFANMYLAYEGLSKGMQALLDGLGAINTSAVALSNLEKRGPNTSIKTTAIDHELCAEHPVVFSVPETGRKALYINEGHTRHFKDMTREESLPLITYLCRQAVRPELTFRLRWEVGTLTIWDNRCTQHYPLNDYHGYRRMMLRVTVAGGRPSVQANQVSSKR